MLGVLNDLDHLKDHLVDTVVASRSSKPKVIKN